MSFLKIRSSLGSLLKDIDDLLSKDKNYNDAVNNFAKKIVIKTRVFIRHKVPSKTGSSTNDGGLFYSFSFNFVDNDIPLVTDLLNSPFLH